MRQETLAASIPEISTGEDMLYLCVIIDLFSKLVVG